MCRGAVAAIVSTAAHAIYNTVSGGTVAAIVSASVPAGYWPNRKRHTRPEAGEIRLTSVTKMVYLSKRKRNSPGESYCAQTGREEIRCTAAAVGPDRNALLHALRDGSCDRYADQPINDS